MIRTTLPQCHFKLIQDNANRICKQFSSLKINPKELYFTGYMALLHAQECFQSGRNAKFETFASTCIYHDMMKEIRWVNNIFKSGEAESYQCRFLKLDDITENEMQQWEEQESDRFEHALLEALDDELEQLHSKDRELLDQYFGLRGEPKTLKQLGDTRGVSHQAIHKRINKIFREVEINLLHRCA